MSFFDDLSNFLSVPLLGVLGLRPVEQRRDGVAADIEAARARLRREVRPQRVKRSGLMW